MNTVHMDPRCIPLGMVRTPGAMMPPIIGRHQLIRHPGIRLPHPGMGPGLGPGPPPMPGQGIFVEEQMEHLAGKLDMLENELRYAWRALDVLSQEYIKMWERLEKMEGLLTEQQTVITQLIDLYTADSSDNAENEFESNGREITRFQGFGGSGKDPDESFYKALNMVHQDSYPNTQDNMTLGNFNTANTGSTVEKSPKSTKSNKKQNKGPKEIEYIDNFNIGNDGNTVQVQAKVTKDSSQPTREDSDLDLKSMTSSMRSTHSGFSEVGEFPVPADTSPTYENLMPAATLVAPALPPAPAGPAPKRKLPQLPHPADNRRTRKDGYIGDQNTSGPTELPSNFPVGLNTVTISQNQIQGFQGGNISMAPGGRYSKGSLDNGKTFNVAPNQQSGKPSAHSQPATNVFTSSGNHQDEVQYDTYPRRKKKKDKPQQQQQKSESGEIAASSPLTVIDGNYSFSLSDDKDHMQRNQQKQRDMKTGESTDLSSHKTSQEMRDNKEQLAKQSEDIRGKQIRAKSGTAVKSDTAGESSIPTSSGKGQLLPPAVGMVGSESISQSVEQDVNSPSDNSLARTNSLFQQIHAREGDTSLISKSRKLSLKEKRKLRAEQRDLTEFLPKSVEIEEPQVTIPKKDSSESDVSMRSDHSVSPKRETDEMEQLEQARLSGNGMQLLDQQGAPNGTRPRSNGINLLPVQQQMLSSAKPSSREFAVSRALGKYRQKQKKERENTQGSSNSDSQDELEFVCEPHGDDGGIESTLKSLDAKLAEIEEDVEPIKASLSSGDAKTSIPAEKVQKQVSEFEEAGILPIELAKTARGKPTAMSRRQSTEEGIDIEDEWYQHEILRLQKLEYEQELQKIHPSDSVGNKMDSVLGELHTKVIPVSEEECNKAETDRRKSLSETIKIEPPDIPPEKPPDKKADSARRVSRRLSKKQLLEASKSDIEDEDDSDSSVTGSADDDSETQSGADCVSEEDDDYAIVRDPEPYKRPGVLTILPHTQKLNISNIPNKPDLLIEVTAAAAESAYPEHLKNGAYGEDGLWYDDQGETGYYAEDGEWYDYMDEIGFYSDGGEWHEYDYDAGYWGDDGEWKNKDMATSTTTESEIQNPGSEADHFLWVSEEGINEYSNDQIPSSELQPTLVIGKQSSGSLEETSHFESDYQGPNGSYTINEHLEPDEVLSSRIPEVIVKIDTEHVDENEVMDNENESQQLKGGGRWGALIKQRKADIIDLVRH